MKCELLLLLLKSAVIISFGRVVQECLCEYICFHSGSCLKDRTQGSAPLQQRTHQQTFSINLLNLVLSWKLMIVQKYSGLNETLQKRKILVDIIIKVSSPSSGRSQNFRQIYHYDLKPNTWHDVTVSKEIGTVIQLATICQCRGKPRSEINYYYYLQFGLYKGLT